MKPILNVKMIDLSIKPIPMYYGISWFISRFTVIDYWNQYIRSHSQNLDSISELVKFLKL